MSGTRPAPGNGGGKKRERNAPAAASDIPDVARRILVVDDVDAMRALIRRALAADGYEVDVAATLAEARALDPGRYDAVLVDARLGAEQGTDLVEELQAADPAMAGRCLVISGGPPGPLLPGVAHVRKPFRPDQLLAAVRALHQPGPGPAAPGKSPPAEPQPGGPPQWRLLGAIRRLRERERAERAGFLHDGPVQELAAAALELELIRRSSPADRAGAIGGVMRRLDTAAGALRRLLDEEWRGTLPGAGLDAAIRERTTWLLAAPPTVDTDPRAMPHAAEVPVLVDVIELMLLAMLPAGPPADVHVAVRVERPSIEVVLTVTPPGDAPEHPDLPAAQASLGALASALHASVHWAVPGPVWRVTLALPGLAALPAPRLGQKPAQVRPADCS